MIKDRVIQLVALLVMVVCAVGATGLIRAMNIERRELQLGADTQIDERVPPEYALLAQLGSFRGIAVNALWYQLEMQKRDGKFFEANTLSRWITKLQPRFPQVWAFMAWNMAYNISVKTKTPQERWDWVNKGIRLLREEGIPNNPNAIRLYRELGWILFHKVGGRTDDMHNYYKTQLAKEWHTLLGGDVEYLTPEAYEQRFGLIAEMTRTYFVSSRTEALVGEPSSETLTRFRAQNGDVGTLLDMLDELGFEPDPRALRAIGEILMYRQYYSWTQIDTLDDDRLSDDARKVIPLIKSVDQQRYEALRNATPEQRRNGQVAMPLWQAMSEALLPFLRAQTLIREYNMDPRFMHELIQQFGPVDWRAAAGQSLYWYAMGVERAYDKRDRTKIDQINTDRGIIHSLQSLFREGSLSFDPLGGPWKIGSVSGEPNIHFIASYEQAMQNAKDRAIDVDWGVGNDTTYEAGHENFLHDAIRAAYLYDPDPSRTMARELYDKVRQLYWKQGQVQGTWQDDYNLTLDDFVMTTMIEDLSMQQVPIMFIESQIAAAFLQGWGLNRPGVFRTRMELARKAHVKAQQDREGGDNPNAMQHRRALAPFNDMALNTYIRIMVNPGPSLLAKRRVYGNSQIQLRLLAYDRIINPLRQQAYAEGLKPDIMFPAPAGLEEYRAFQRQQIEQGGSPQRNTVERQ